MATKSKMTVSFEIEADQQAWLENKAKDHDLPDASKALRVLLDYAMEETEDNDVFGKVRCLRCG